MKIQINTQEKKIRILEECSFTDLITWMEETFDDWKDWRIEQTVEYVYNPTTTIYHDFSTSQPYPTPGPFGWEVTCIQ